MQGLEKVYFDLNDIRSRLVRLVDMGRLEQSEGMEIMPHVLKLMNLVNEKIESDDEDIIDEEDSKT